MRPGAVKTREGFGRFRGAGRAGVGYGDAVAPSVYDRLFRTARARGAGPSWAAGAALVLAGAAAGVAALPLLDGILAQAPRAGAAVERVAVRVALLVAAVAALRGADAVVRSPERPVLDAHPVDGRALTRALVRRAAVGLLPGLAASVLALGGLALRVGPGAWAAGALVVVGGGLGGLGVGAAMHLGAVDLALRPAAAPLLDALRGANPRPQAALIYAPGVAIFVVGAAIFLAGAGAGAALDGRPAGLLWAALPVALGLAGAAVAPRLGARLYARATLVLAEVDAAYGLAPRAEAAAEVYLGWAARGSPERLRALRAGWRRLRPWPVLLWAVGGLTALVAAGRDAAAPGVAAAAAGLALAVAGVLPARLAALDPPWLTRALGLGGLSTVRARAEVALLYGVGAWLPGLLVALLRHGGAALAPWAGLPPLALGAAGLGALAAARWGAGAAPRVAPVFLLGWTAFAAWSIR